MIPKQIFITGTDTDVGKSFVAAVLTYGFKAAYFKPIQSGTETATDRQWVQKTTELPEEHFFEESYLLQSPLSPHASAKIDGIEISIDQIELPNHSGFEHLIVEGAGGVFVPLNDRGDMISDLCKKWRIPTLIVCRSGLGTLNHSLMTVEHLRRREIPIWGIIMNGPKNSSNKEALERFAKVPVFGEFERVESISTQTLQSLFNSLNFERKV